MNLALLNLGPSEVLLVLVLLVLLFGVDRVPQLARSLGRFKGEMERARRQFERAVEDEEARALREQLEFERQREAQMRAQVQPALDAEVEEARAVREAATALGLPTEGKSVDELRAAIGQRLQKHT
jgi:sec-independent protein translocase protein TatA